MSDTFDPYHKWLGIPPAEQPPNHYRLLGVAAFESDADVIDAAANQRMAYLQDMAVGPHVDHSQRLLNEISAARRCLLNPEAKSAYDSQLQTQTAADTPGADAPFVPIITTDAPAASATATRLAMEKKPKQPDPETAEATPPAKLSPAWIAAFSSIGVLSLIIALFLIFGGEQKTQADSGTLKVKWKLDERESALMMIDGKEVFDSVSKHPDKTETLSFSVAPGRHDFYFERAGYRAIRTSYKFLPGESHGIALQWRRR